MTADSAPADSPDTEPTTETTNETGADATLVAEREHLRFARDCLVEMRASTEAITDAGTDELLSHSLGRMRAERLAWLSADPDAPAFFGRIDRNGPPAESLHIGRRHVRDERLNPVVIDWRAPIARPFYRATAADPMGVRLRRRFGFDGNALSSFEDEHLDRGEALGLRSDLLREEIERPRVGPMRDIVATIQPDQDELVRADLDTSLCVQGAPGTGKTAVGLHRAAYLLYTFPDRLRRTGVLVVGPNKAFLDYIAQVLPALGEGGIAQNTVDDLVAERVGRGQARGQDEPRTAVLKGDARLAEVLRRAVLVHVAKPVDDVVCLVGTKRYRIPERRLRRYVDDARRELRAGDLHWNPGRDRLKAQLGEDVRRQREAAGGAPTDAETAKVSRSAPVKDFVAAVWPALDAGELLLRLYTDADWRRRIAGAVLSDDELDRLAWPQAPRSVRTAKWSPADLVLLDELESVLSGGESFVHVVVDEAQDLSAMQCRAVARRSPLGSLTVLGDLAQATTPWAPGSWPATLEHLGRPGAEVRPLTVGYRVPGEVLTVANRLLPHIAPSLPPATSVRPGRDSVSHRGQGELIEAVRWCAGIDGSLGVVVRDVDVPDTVARLTVAGLSAAALGAAAEHRVEVVPASAAKGLEFDSVVLVDPAAIVEAEPDRRSGLRRLYVVLTRAVSRLVVVHDEALPVELAG